MTTLEKLTPEQIKEQLGTFIGTNFYHRTSSLMKGLSHTDGVSFLCETCQSYWLLDIIVSVQYLPAVKNQEFQSWRLSVKDETADITCDDGNGKVLYTQHIEFTDFPLSNIHLYLTNNVILLPSEY